MQPVRSVAFLLLILLLSACGRTLMPTPEIYRAGSAPLDSGLSQELEGDVVRIPFVTDRLPGAAKAPGGVSYGNERSLSAAFGLAAVRISGGTTEKPADASPSNPMQRRRQGRMEIESVEEVVRFPATPYMYHVGDDGEIVMDPEVARELDRSTVKARREIERLLALTPRKEVYVFVHGVANRFDDAIYAAAEFWHFLGREGVPIAYTWPAGKEGLIFYAVDRESGEFTILHLKQFLTILAGIPGVEKIHIASHSRGTDVVTTALRELIIELRAAGIDPRAHLKVENLLLIAADMDLQVAIQRLVGEALGPGLGRTTIYVNANDKALAAAKALFNSRQRLGALKPTKLTPQQRLIMGRIANLDIVVYSGDAGDMFRHDYFRDPKVSSDIIALLRYGSRPGKGHRGTLRRIDASIWQL